MKKEAENKEKTIIKVVPDNFPIESYLDGEGNQVLCVKESEYKAQVMATQFENKEELSEIKKVLNV